MQSAAALVVDKPEPDDVNLFTVSGIVLPVDIVQHILMFNGMQEHFRFGLVCRSAQKSTQDQHIHIVNYIRSRQDNQMLPDVIADQRGALTFYTTQGFSLIPSKFVVTSAIVSYLRMCMRSLIPLLMLINEQTTYNVESNPTACRDTDLADYIRDEKHMQGSARRILYKLFVLLCAVLVRISVQHKYIVRSGSYMHEFHDGVQHDILECMVDAVSYMRDRCVFADIWKLLSQTLNDIIPDHVLPNNYIVADLERIIRSILYSESWRAGRISWDFHDLLQLQDLAQLSYKVYQKAAVQLLFREMWGCYLLLVEEARIRSDDDVLVRAASLFTFLTVMRVDLVRPLLLECVAFTLHMERLVVITPALPTPRTVDNRAYRNTLAYILGRYHGTRYTVKAQALSTYIDAQELFASMEADYGLPETQVERLLLQETLISEYKHAD
jgi:hypothetical protein